MKISLQALLIPICLGNLGSLNLGAQEGASPILRTEDVIYGRKFGMALTMDVFQPAKPNKAGILFLVNGGWLSSKATPLMVTIDPKNYQPYLDRGYTVFAVVTSSQPAFTITDIMGDVQRATRYIRAHADRFRIEPNRLGVLGSSSGGQLALMLATQGGPGKPDAPDPVDRASSAVQAAACFFPPTDFLNYGGPGKDGVGMGPMDPLKVAFGPRALTESGRKSLGKEISPIYHITSKLPPTLIISGDNDPVVPLQQSGSFMAKAKSLGAKDLRLVIRPGKGHGWGDFWKSKEDTEEFVHWFDKFLNN